MRLVLDAFAGAGGASLGLASLGLDPIGIELDADACATHAAAGLRTVRADLSSYPWPEHLRGRVDVLHASPPCQPWSAGGRGRGVEDPRDGMPWLLRAVEALEPRLVTVENVAGLTYKRHRPHFDAFVENLGALGYDVEWRILNAADYGIPQTRRRLLVVARRDGVAPKWPDPTHAKHGADGRLPWATMAEALGWGDGDLNTGRDWKPGGDRSTAQTRSVDEPAPTVSSVPEQWLRPGNMSNRTSERTWTPRMKRVDEPAPSIAPGHDVAQWAWIRPATTVYGDVRVPAPGHHAEDESGSQMRDAVRVTLEELAVLQGFPPDHPFVGTRTSRARQIGNALPPALIAAVVGANLSLDADDRPAVEGVRVGIADVPARDVDEDVVDVVDELGERAIGFDSDSEDVTHLVDSRPRAAESNPGGPVMSQLLDLGAAIPDPTRRDQYGRYLVVPPGETLPFAYTRATTVADTLESGRGLMAWHSMMSLAGAIGYAELEHELRDLMSAGNGNPWYASDELKAACKDLVERCAVAGGSRRRAELGTFLHSAAELLDTTPGISPAEVNEAHADDLEAYWATLEEWNVSLVPELTEAMVVLDSYLVAGRGSDRVARIPWLSTRHVILDLKTGAELSYSWLSIAVQLAIYAHAEARYVQGDAPDGSGDERLELRRSSTRRRPSSRTCRLARGDATSTSSTSSSDGVCSTSLDVRRHRSSSVFARPIATRARLSPEPLAPLDEPPTRDLRAEVRAWLQARVDTIGAHPQARERLPWVWPAGVAPLKRSDAHTDDELAAIETMCDDLERDFSIPFGPSRPGDDEAPDGARLARLRAVVGPFTTHTKGADDA